MTLTDTGGAVLTLMLGYRSLYITWQHRFCRIVCELSLRILICILPKFANSNEFYNGYGHMETLWKKGCD